MDTFGRISRENEMSSTSFTKLEKVLLGCLEVAFFLEVIMYNMTSGFFNKTKNFWDAVAMLHQSTKQKIIESRTTIVVLGRKMQL